MDRVVKWRPLLKFVTFFLLIPLILFMALISTENEVGRNFRAVLKSVFENELIEVDDWPQSQTFDAVYILGGNIRAQRYKFEVAAKIYTQNICRKIYMLSNKGRMGYDESLKRNPTVDEWSILNLEKSGVSSADVVAITMGRGMLGTMTEAENVVEMLMQNKSKSILLVASPYHSRRVRLTFEHFIRGNGVDVAVLGSGEPKYLRSLSLEWLKLKLYEVLCVLN